MTRQSPAETSPDKANVPAIRSFEFNDAAVGDIKTSVNQFRGTLSLPIDFLTLEGRKGLDVKVSALYSSNIARDVETWNLDAPTGILGLGWQMPVERIVVETSGNGSPASDRHFLIAGGSANPMICTGTDTAGRQSYQLRQFQFWQITYDPADESWRIVKEDGTVHSYGGPGAANAVQWGVRWGNFTGSSSRLDGQERYARAWNLARTETVAGDAVSYEYRATEVAVGDRGGRTYTQASYVSQITDSLGRVVKFVYGEKYGAGNPSPQQIVEYQAANTGKPAPNAYQDVYETLYLERVEVFNAQGRQIHGLTYTYDFINLAATTDPARDLMWKRVLTSVFQWSPEGRVLPSMRFAYDNDTSAVNPGALIKITYPGGAEASVGYKELVLDAPRRTTLKNPLGQATPGVWHGPDYVLTSFTGASGFRLLVSTWNGRWQSVDITPAALRNAQIDPQSLWASPQEGYLAVSGRDTQGNRDVLCLFRPDPAVFGAWTLDVQGVRYLDLRAGKSGRSVYAAGRDYVIAGNLDFSAGVYQGFSWDWQRQAWSAPPIRPSGSQATANGNFALAAFDTYYVAATWDAKTRRIGYETFYRAADRSWQPGGSWHTANVDIAEENGQRLLAVVAQSSYLATTYVTSTSVSAINYAVAVHQLDERFAAINGPSPKTMQETAAVDNGTAAYNVFQTVASQNYLNNNLINLRNEGGDQRASANVNWVEKTLTLAAGERPNFASEIDATAFVTVDGAQRTTAEILRFDPNQPASAAWQPQPNVVQSGSAATVFGSYLTIGETVYFNRTDGSWRALSQQLTGLGPEASVANRAPNYIAFQDSDDASAHSYIVATRNGDIGPVQVLPGGPQKVSVPADAAGPGSNLAGLRFLVTYPSAEDFDQAGSLTLINLDNGVLEDFARDTPVAWTAIANPFDPDQGFVESFIYANSSTAIVSYDTRTGLAQYPEVSVVTGVKTTGNDLPRNQPDGRSEYYYSNGVSPQDSLKYPTGWILNYDQTLNGIELARRDFDARGDLVAEQLNYWQVFTKGPGGRQLFGSYAKPVETRTTRDAVTVTSFAEFDSESGLERSRRQDYHDSRGNRKWLSKSLVFAHEVPEYKVAFEARHYLSAIARMDRAVTDNASGKVTVIESKATTWKDWSAGAAPSRLAKSGSWQWKAEGSTPDFDYSGGANAGWVREAEILSRSAKSLLIEEQIDARGAASSFVYDSESRYLVASFPGAARSAGWASYWGAEPYEAPDGWSLGRGAEIVPPSAQGEIDAHTGTRAIRLNPGAATGTEALRRNWIARGKGRMIVSAWVKRPEGFDTSAGAAELTVVVNGTLTARSPFPDPCGDWLYLAAGFDLTADKSDITVSLTNANTEAPVLVDNLCIAPGDCTWSATGFDTRLWLPDAKLEANGVTSRSRYDPFGRVVLRTNARDELSEIATHYQSRDGHEGSFDPADPNSQAVLRPASGGRMETFTRGGAWRATWAPGAAGDWQSSGGMLTNAGATGPATLTAATADPARGFALGAQLRPVTTPVGALGISVGTSVKLDWNPATGLWNLTGPGTAKARSGEPLTGHDRVMTLALPEEARASLRSGAPATVPPQIVTAFARRGLHLPRDARVARHPETGVQEIHPPGADYRYVLTPLDDAEEAKVAVHRVGGVWQLLVHKRSLVFRIDGKVIFSEVFDNAITGALTLHFDSQVEISDLALGHAPAAAVNYTDTTGIPLQQQGLEHERMTVSQFLADSHGRLAVKAKPAWIAASDKTPLLAYTPDMARLDWTSGQMTGRVAEAYPDDGGFPYAREVFEASPLGRTVASGLPGADFAIGAHDSRIAYGANDGSHGLPVAGYLRETVTDPNGNVTTTISTTLGQVVVQSAERTKGQLITSFVIYDDAGNPVERRQPNYFDPPADSLPEDWVIAQSFDFAGRPLTKTIGRTGSSQFVYSDAGDLRFMEDPEGAAGGTYLYWTYDRLGRPLENGYLTGSFDRKTLTAKATEAPGWPATPDTWRKRQHWDGTDPAANAIGRLTQVETSQSDEGTSASRDSYRYDLFGNTVQIRQAVTGVSGDRQTDYAFDAQGSPLAVQYPRDIEGTRWRLSYRYDALGRVSTISQGETGNEELIRYAYRADGRPEAEQRPGDGSTPSDREYAYNPPLWPTRLHDSTATAALFTEELSYTAGGYKGAGYYDGVIAKAGYPAAGGAPAHDFAYAYNGLGEIETADCAAEPEWSLGTDGPVRYDANGNMRAANLGTREIAFTYVAQTQRLKTLRDVTGGGDVEVARYTYTKNGAAKTSKTVGTPFENGREIAFDHDPGISRPVAARVAGGDDVTYRYGATGRRVLKTVPRDNGAVEQTVYAYGADNVPLYEQAPRDEMLYGFGPQGLALLRHNGKVYYILRDHLGSVRRLLDDKNAVVADFDYLPYGTVSRSSGPALNATNLRFTGHRFDADLGLYDTPARFYGAQIGRFLDTDPMSQFNSPYTYAANNPVLYVDPDGRFSIGSLFSAIAGVIIGAVEILIGVAIDVVAGVLEVVTGGLATPAAVALAAAAGFFYGAGASSIIYSVLNVQSFDWKEYGISMGVGAVAGAISFGFGALGTAAATSAGATATVQAASKATQTVVEYGIKAGFGAVGGAVSGTVSTSLNDVAHNVTPGFDVVSGSLWGAVSTAITAGTAGPAYKAGFKEFGKRVLINTAKKEAIGISVSVTRNAVNGDPLDKGLVNTAVSGAVWGSIGAVGAKSAGKETTEDAFAAIGAMAVI